MKEKIFENFSLKLISLIGALILWAVIVNIYDPTTSVTISNVAVTLQNEESLTGNDYSYEVVDGDRISVYISGPKSVITELKSSDIVATADLSKITAFADYVDIDVKVVKDGVELKNVEVIPRTTAVKLQIENRLTKEFTIKYYTEGSLADGYTLGGVSVFPDTVKVTGSSSAVNNVENAVVTLDIAGRTGSFNENVAISLIDSDGNTVEDETLVMSRGDADCAVTVNQVKTVKVTAAGYVGTVSDGYVVKGIELSFSEIEITGSVNVVGGIEEISIPSSAIDVSGLSSDKVVSVNLADYVDRSVTFSSDSSVTATARIVSRDSKEYSVAASAIKMNNLSDGLSATIDTSVKTLSISVKADEGDFSSFSASDISLSVNLASLSAGEHIVAVNVSLPDGYSVDGTYRVKVTIERKQPQVETQTRPQNTQPTTQSQVQGEVQTQTQAENTTQPTTAASVQAGVESTVR
jgi:YbbR domain-containing protein